MQGFLLSLRSEFYKTRKTLAFWSAILLPLILCSMIAAGYYWHSDKIINNTAILQWMKYASPCLGVMGTLLLPMLVIFQTFSINNIEHRAEMWKSMFSLPLPKWSMYSAKYVYAVLLILLCLTLFATFTFAFGHLLNILIPELKFNQYDIAGLLYKVYFKLFLSSLGILSIQFLLSLLWGDFIKPMGVGFVLTIFGIITANLGWEYAYTIPYTHPMLATESIMHQVFRGKNMPLDFDLMGREVYVSLAVAAFTFIMGYFVIARRSIK